MSVYLTDDGSVDSTSKLVSEQFPKVIILKGSGKLFWAGGMRNSWNQALKGEYDSYLLLNDDTTVSEHVFGELSKAHQFSIENFEKGGIYIGATNEVNGSKISYSGWNLRSKLLNTYTQILPNNTYQLCSFGNANIMLVTSDVVSKIGIFYSGYSHGLADFDYTLTANKKKIPVIILPNPLGSCESNTNNRYSVFRKLAFKERIRYLVNPVGLGFWDQLTYMKRHFPFRLPFVFLTGIFKVLFPNVYILINKTRI